MASDLPVSHSCRPTVAADRWWRPNGGCLSFFVAIDTVVRQWRQTAEDTGTLGTTAVSSSNVNLCQHRHRLAGATKQSRRLSVAADRCSKQQESSTPTRKPTPRQLCHLASTSLWPSAPPRQSQARVVRRRRRRRQRWQTAAREAMRARHRHLSSGGCGSGGGRQLLENQCELDTHTHTEADAAGAATTDAAR